MYSAQYPAASLAKGSTVRWRWPAKNHANTPAAGTVEVYISNAPNTGDDFAGQGDADYIGQMSYSSDGGDCLGVNQNTDTADCQSTWTVPANLAEGRYTLMWWWEFNAGEFYNTCADVMITAAADGGGGGSGGGGGGGGGGGVTSSPPPPGGSQGSAESNTTDGGSSGGTIAAVILFMLVVAGGGYYFTHKKPGSPARASKAAYEVDTVSASTTSGPAPPRGRPNHASVVIPLPPGWARTWT